MYRGLGGHKLRYPCGRLLQWMDYRGLRECFKDSPISSVGPFVGKTHRGSLGDL